MAFAQNFLQTSYGHCKDGYKILLRNIMPIYTYDIAVNFVLNFCITLAFTQNFLQTSYGHCKDGYKIWLRNLRPIYMCDLAFKNCLVCLYYISLVLAFTQNFLQTSYGHRIGDYKILLRNIMPIEMCNTAVNFVWIFVLHWLLHKNSCEFHMVIV